MHLLATGGVLPVYHPIAGGKQMSPRRRGVRQGAILLLTGAILVPILGVLNSFNEGNLLDILVALASILFFVGGLIRMLFAALFEEGTTQRPQMAPSYVPPSFPAQLNTPARGSALPPAPANPATGWRQRPNTSEILQPPSITENTTRLLDKDEPTKR
jgi:hypothetical protein